MRLVSLALMLLAAGCATFDPNHPLVGKPQQPEPGPAVYVWVSDGLWHVRLVPGAKGGHRFQGSVAGVKSNLSDLQLTRPELKDAVALAGESIQFDVEAPAAPDGSFEGLSGFDVRVDGGGCARFDLYVDGHHHSDKVRLGPRLLRPQRVPFDRCP